MLLKTHPLRGSVPGKKCSKGFIDKCGVGGSGPQPAGIVQKLGIHRRTQAYANHAAIVAP